MPMDEALKPPLNIPINPSSLTAFLMPSHRVYPKPHKGTVAPAPAKSINGLYTPRTPATTPRQTSNTMILPGSSFVRSIRIWTSPQIRPPTKNAFNIIFPRFLSMILNLYGKYAQTAKNYVSPYRFKIPLSSITLTMRSIVGTSRTSAKRTNPSPRLPKLLPGVQSTPVFSTRSIQNSSDDV